MQASWYHTRSSIVAGLRCPRCGATIWFEDGAWACTLCGRALATSRRAPDAPATPDPIAPFLSSRCVRAEGALTSVSVLYATYRTWATAAGRTPLSRPSISQALARAGYQRWRDRHRRYWRGLLLTARGEEPSPSRQPSAA